MKRKQKNQHEINQEIEALIMRKDSVVETYSAEEKEYISRYSGAGGQGKKGARGTGLLYEYFTPPYIAQTMWKLALKFGYDGGPVLDPALGTGRLIANAPDKSKVVGFEISETTRRISEILYPTATFHNGFFETAFMEHPRFTSRLPRDGTWLEQYPFSLVIGNPPFGRYRNYYSGYFKTAKMPTLELFFTYFGLKMLKPGGLLVYLTSSNILRNGSSYNSAKEAIGRTGDLIEAFRLPPVVKHTGVPLDLLIFRKH